MVPLKRAASCTSETAQSRLARAMSLRAHLLWGISRLESGAGEDVESIVFRGDAGVSGHGGVFTFP